jgi:hypothetical protein
MSWKIIFTLSLMALAASSEKDKKKASLDAYFPDAESIYSGMTREDYVEFGRDSLFDYINGGAEVYLDLDFMKVGAREYIAPLEEETYFTLDIYDMAEPVNAFGIFAAERYGEKTEMGLGAASYMTGGSLYFWARNFYVKIRADDEGETVDKILLAMGKQVSDKIGDPGKPPVELALFPQAHRIKGSEKYAKGNLLGFRFLKGFYCQYQNKKEELKLYLGVYGSGKEAQEAEGLLVKKMRPSPKPSEDGVGFVFDSKYQGQGRIVSAGRYLAVVQGAKGDKDSWRRETMEAFFKGITDAALKEKAKKALDQSLKGLDGK